MAIQFDNGGDFSLYRPVSERIPEFIGLYPPKEGWAVHKDVYWGEALFPDRVALFRLAIEQGKDPASLGLPAYPTTLVMVRSALYNAEGRLVAEAHSLGNVRGEKDLEALETASFGRLMSAVGIVGGLATDSGSPPVERYAPPAGAAPAATGPQEIVPVPLAATRYGREQRQAAGAERAVLPEVSPPPEPLATASTEALRQEDVPADLGMTAAVETPAAPAASAPASTPPAEPAPSEPTPALEPIPLVLTAQIAALAEAKGQPAPVPRNPRHARDILKSLQKM